MAFHYMTTGVIGSRYPWGMIHRRPGVAYEKYYRAALERSPPYPLVDSFRDGDPVQKSCLMTSAPRRTPTSRVRLAIATWLTCAGALLSPGHDASASPSDYREPSAAVVGLLTATPPPRPVLHASSGQVALLYREPVIEMDRLARTHYGLAGYRFDPLTGTSGIEPLVTRVEILAANAPGAAPVLWQPAAGQLLDFVQFSPDGRTLSAIEIGNGPARLALFDIASGAKRILDPPINPAWGDPCSWASAGQLICRVVPAGRGPVPARQPAPVVVEHSGDAAPVRTYSNLLDNGYEDSLFEYYFGSGVAAIDLAGGMRRVPELEGLLYDLEPSPDGAYAVVRRLQPPYSRLVPARYFPSSVEVWDLARGERLYASRPEGYGVEAGDEDDEDPRRSAWKPGTTSVLGFIEKRCDDVQRCVNHWLELSAPFTGEPVEVVSSDQAIQRFGWTTAGTPWFTTKDREQASLRYQVVFPDGVQTIWSGTATNDFDDLGHALRRDGADGPVLEHEGRIFIAGDGLLDRGPQPFLESFDLRERTTRRLFTAQPGVYEIVLGMLAADPLTFITSRESESEPPGLYLYREGKRTALRVEPSPYPQLAGVRREVLEYTRGDGVALSGTLYLPANYRPGKRLPTLVWIYPYEFSARDQAERLDVRAFRYHQVKGPSPLAAVVAGYAVLLNPTVPILYSGSAVNDAYLEQLVASLEAAVDYLVEIDVTDPERVAVAGRSYGAFSTANLLIHSDRFATGIAMSGAYNRTLTPFGFQHEKRSFWQATDLYTSISPFFHANEVKKPILLVHGGADENPGTPPLQAQRFFHALVGEGKQARYLELPYEGHHYWARENVLLTSAEMLDWLQRTIGPGTGVGGSSK